MPKLKAFPAPAYLLPFILWLWYSGFSSAQDRAVAKLVYLIIDGESLIASNIKFNRFDEIRLQAREKIQQQAVANAVIAVVTNKRVLGYSVHTAAWKTRNIEAEEEIIDISAQDYSALVITSKRILSFNGRNGIWAQTPRPKGFR